MFGTSIIEKLKLWKQYPLQFVKDTIDVTPSDQQMEGLHLLGKSNRLTIRSGHGTGKDAFASWAIMWFQTTRVFSKTACTAPTARQLDDILWSELSKWIRRSKLREEFVIQKNKIFHKDSPKEWWVRAISPGVKASKEEQAETLAGLHGDHLFIVVDEASGVNDPVFIPLEGALTQEDNRVLLIGNMTRNSGYFYDSHYHPTISKLWDKLHWDSSKSTNVMPGYVEYMATKYGVDSNVYRIRVQGEPPLEDEKTFIPLAWSQQCMGNDIDVSDDAPVYLGVDVARYGEDKSIILPRHGLRILPWSSFQSMNTITFGGHIVEAITELGAEGIVIDEIGVGAGVTDWLLKIPRAARHVVPVTVSASSSNKMRWHRLRDELWWMVRERCQKQQYSFPVSTPTEREMSNELCDELSCLTYEYDNNGAYQLESKRQAKLRGVSSPNIADALANTEYIYGIVHRLFQGKNKEPKPKRPWDLEDETPATPQSWMAM